jgi:hypothetical protein
MRRAHEGLGQVRESQKGLAKLFRGGNRGARRWHRPHRVPPTAWATNFDSTAPGGSGSIITLSASKAYDRSRR